MLANLFSAALMGIDAFKVTLEADLSRSGLPVFTMIGTQSLKHKAGRSSVDQDRLTKGIVLAEQATRESRNLNGLTRQDAVFVALHIFLDPQVMGGRSRMEGDGLPP